MLCCVLGSLVLPTVSPLVPGVSASEDVVASGLVVGGGAGVGVVVPGPGFWRGWLGFAGCGRSPLLAEGLVGPPLCPSGVSGGPAAPLAGGYWVLVLWVCVCCVCGAGGACAFVCGVRLWGSFRWRLWWCVLCACAGVCAVCWWCVWVPVLAFLGLVWRLCVGVGAVCRGPSPVSAVSFPAPPGWGLLVVCPPAAPFACPPPSVSLPRRLGRCSPGAVPGPSLLWWSGGGPCRRLGSLPLVFPLGGADACTPHQGVTLLYGPSICTCSVQMDLLRSQVLQPFPTPGSGTLWVAGESLRDRRVSCLPRWTVCPIRSPSLGPNRSTCRGECSWSGPLVTPPGRCHRGPLTNGPGRIPPYCVCSGGADTVTGGAPKPLRLGPSPVPPVGPFRPAPHFAVWFAVVGFPSLPGAVVVVGGVFCFSWPCCLCAFPRLPWLWFAVGVCVCGAVRARVVSVLVCVSCVRGGVGVGVPSVCVGVCVCVCGCVVWGRLGLAAGVGVGVVGVCRGWSLVGWGPLAAVVCGVWCVVCGVWCAGVVCWWGCCWCVVWLVPRHSWRRFLCATPRHSWLGFAAGGGGRSSPLLAEGPGCGSPPLLAGVRWQRWCVVCGVWFAAVMCWWGCGWCVVWLVPRHSWLRVPRAVPRHSWLGFAVGGGGCSSPLLAEGPGCGSPPLLAGVRWRRWCFVCGVWCVVCGVWFVAVGCWWGCGWCVVWLVPRHSWRRFLCATPRHSWLGFAAGGGGRSPPLLAEGPGCASPPVLAGVRWRRWCVVCGVWCAAVVCWWGCGWCVVWLVPRHSWRRSLCATPRHSWLGFAAGGGGRSSPLLAEGPGCGSPPLLPGFRCRRWWALLATPG